MAFLLAHLEVALKPAMGLSHAHTRNVTKKICRIGTDPKSRNSISVARRMESERQKSVLNLQEGAAKEFRLGSNSRLHVNDAHMRSRTTALENQQIARSVCAKNRSAQIFVRCDSPISNSYDRCHTEVSTFKNETQVAT